MKCCQHVGFDCSFATIFGACFFKKPQVLAQSGLSMQKPKQKADENTNPKGIFDQRQEEEVGLSLQTGSTDCARAPQCLPLTCPQAVADMWGWELSPRFLPIC